MNAAPKHPFGSGPSSRTGKVHVGPLLWLVWFAALAASHLYQRTRSQTITTPNGASAFTVALETKAGRVQGSTQLHVFESGPATAPKILLLHGSPGNHADFVRVGPRLAQNKRVLVPDLPGFGVVDQDLPDYSFEAYARYLVDWMDQAGIDRLHVVGFSMGSAVALHLWEMAPGRIVSMTLAAGLGVEEWELLGDHRLNHALHGLLLGVVRTIDWVFPHFGSFDRFPVGVAHARNFYDSDQRKLRPLLEALAIPTLIVHGTQDVLIPEGAAKEHARIVPQAELVLLPEQNHFLPWTASETLASTIETFVNKVEAGEALRRENADPERTQAAALPFDPFAMPAVTGFALVLLVILLAASTLVSEDLTCLAAGWLVAQGRIEFLPATLGCFLGILIGDLLLYALGRWFGRPALERRPLSRLVRPEALHSASAWFKKRGIWVVFLSRFTPGLRLPTYLLAGALRTRFWAFAGFFALAALLWTPALVGLSAWLGERFLPREGDLGSSLWRVLPWLLLGYGVLHWVLLPSLTHAGRRRLVGKCKRLTEFEYWPSWALYGPILPFLVWQALRFRSLTVFSAANPGMQGGGFAGESKGDILDGFQADPAIARYLRLPARTAFAERLDAAESWMATNALAFPVVLKPDVGERGKDVRIVRDREHLQLELEKALGAFLLQEYIGGQEFGVFYRWDPRTGEGQIVSITEKHLPSLVGDGQRTLGALVLDDRRAVAMAAAYQRGLGERWDSVPLEGESVRLVEIGTHARGSIFQNGAQHHSPELVRTIDAISRKFRPLPDQPANVPGLGLGRYDLKAPDASHLTRGLGIRILELNGVTSEPTHIYDAKEPLGRALVTLARQWRWAFEIGHHLRGRGVRVASIRELWQLSRRRS